MFPLNKLVISTSLAMIAGLGAAHAADDAKPSAPKPAAAQVMTNAAMPKKATVTVVKDLLITVGDKAKIQVSVRTADNQPIAGAQIQYAGNNTGYVPTGADGIAHFTIGPWDKLPGVYPVELEFNGMVEHKAEYLPSKVTAKVGVVKAQTAVKIELVDIAGPGSMTKSYSVGSEVNFHGTLKRINDNTDLVGRTLILRGPDNVVYDTTVLDVVKGFATYFHLRLKKIPAEWVGKNITMTVAFEGDDYYIPNIATKSFTAVK